MKNFILTFVALSALSCSFDNKTGIWKDASDIPVNNQEVTSIEKNNKKIRYEDVFTKSKMFDEEKNAPNELIFQLDNQFKTNNWLEQYGDKTNNVSNFSYSGNKTLLSKSSKLSKLSLNKNIVFHNDSLITFDHKGRIFIYSLKLRKKIFEYNFYKKSYKKFKKKIYLVVNNNVLYAADNLGYLYAIDLNNKSLIWAKNYGIPFRSNIKIVDEQILLATQDNIIYSINLKTGASNWQFATNQTFLKSDFHNNFVIDKPKENLFFLNTSGELYSINYANKKINWMLNFRGSALPGDTRLFLSQPIIVKKDNLIVSTEEAISHYNTITSIRTWSFPSKVILKPIITSNYTYIFTSNDLLICLSNKTGDVLWSKNIFNDIREKKTINKIGKFHDLKIANNELNLFSKNGYLLSFNYANGDLEYIKKISKNGISSEAVFVKDNMYLLDNNNRLLKFN